MSEETKSEIYNYKATLRLNMTHVLEKKGKNTKKNRQMLEVNEMKALTKIVGKNIE